MKSVVDMGGIYTASGSSKSGQGQHIGVADCEAGLMRTAGDAAERHGLRGYDAVHLASAEVIHGADPICMHTRDHDLAEAAVNARINGIRIVDA